jgi:hypothetical protein
MLDKPNDKSLDNKDDINQKEIENLQARTDSKLRYAQLHLDELKERSISHGDDFDRAHQESFLYHLIGAKDSFLIELNTYYKTGLVEQEISMGKIREALNKRGRKSLELKELYELEIDDNSWFSHAKAIRDHSTHVSNVPRHFHIGGVNDNLVFISNPKTGKVIKRHIIDEFSDWLTLMNETLKRLRTTAITTNSLTKDI